jgi:hypothetical protein
MAPQRAPGGVDGVRRALAQARADAPPVLDAAIRDLRLARAKLWRIEARATEKLCSACSCPSPDCGAAREATIRRDAAGDALDVLLEVAPLLDLAERQRELHTDAEILAKLDELEDAARMLRQLFGHVCSGAHRDPDSAAIAVDALPLYEAEAKERQRASGGDHKAVSPKMGEPVQDAGKAADFAATAFGVSRGYVEDARAIKKRDPEAFEAIKAGDAGA